MPLVLIHSLDEGARISSEETTLEVIVRVIGRGRTALEVIEKDKIRVLLLYQNNPEIIAPGLGVCQAYKQNSFDKVRLVYLDSDDKYHILRRELLNEQEVIP